MSEAVAQAVQHVDTRSAAEFRAGKKPVSSQLAHQEEPQPEVKSSSQAAEPSKPLGNSDIAAKARPEILQRLQRISDRQQVEATPILPVCILTVANGGRVECLLELPSLAGSSQPCYQTESIPRAAFAIYL